MKKLKKRKSSQGHRVQVVATEQNIILILVVCNGRVYILYTRFLSYILNEFVCFSLYVAAYANSDADADVSASAALLCMMYERFMQNWQT